jgi:hypothetical protein
MAANILAGHNVHAVQAQSHDMPAACLQDICTHLLCSSYEICLHALQLFAVRICMHMHRFTLPIR